MRNVVAGLLVGGLVAASAVPAAAQGRERGAGTAEADSLYRAALEALQGEPIGLEEALRLARDEATSVREAEAAFRAAEGALLRERGAYDIYLFADWELREEDTPAASPFAGAPVVETETNGGSAGARLKLPFGTELEARLNSGRLRTNSEFAAFNPEYSARGELGLRQPLLRGLGVGTDAPVASASLGVEAALSRWRDAVLAVDSDVTTTYWDLRAAERDLAVQRLIVDRAEAFLEEAERRADVGLVGPGEVATARVFLTEQSILEIDREERLDAVSDRLVSLIGRSPSGADRWHPSTSPPAAFAAEDEPALVARALERNGEVLAARSELAAARKRLDGARRNLLPVLDVVGTVGSNGLSGEGQEIPDFGGGTVQVPDRGGRGESVQQVVQNDYPVWSVGVEVEVPLFFREGRGERDRLEAEVAVAEQRLIDAERTVREDVRARHRELEHGIRRLELADQGVAAAADQVRIGTIEYDAGRVTAFELVRLAADYATAQQTYSDALVRTAKAAAELRRLAPPADVESALLPPGEDR